MDKHWKNAIISCLGFADDKAKWEEALEFFSAELPKIEATLAKQGSAYFVGDEMTLADILFFRIFALLFNFVLGASQRESLPALTAWYQRIFRNPLFTGVAGNLHMCAEAWTVCGSDKTIKFGGAAVEEVK